MKTGSANELRDHRGVEACGIVLYGDGVRVFIEGEPADSVYLARVGESEADRFSGRRGITENNVDGCHRHSIAVWR